VETGLSCAVPSRPLGGPLHYSPEEIWGDLNEDEALALAIRLSAEEAGPPSDIPGRATPSGISDGLGGNTGGGDLDEEEALAFAMRLSADEAGPPSGMVTGLPSGISDRLGGNTGGGDLDGEEALALAMRLSAEEADPPSGILDPGRATPSGISVNTGGEDLDEEKALALAIRLSAEEAVAPSGMPPGLPSGISAGEAGPPSGMARGPGGVARHTGGGQPSVGFAGGPSGERGEDVEVPSSDEAMEQRVGGGDDDDMLAPSGHRLPPSDSRHGPQRGGKARVTWGGGGESDDDLSMPLGGEEVESGPGLQANANYPDRGGGESDDDLSLPSGDEETEERILCGDQWAGDPLIGTRAPPGIGASPPLGIGTRDPPGIGASPSLGIGTRDPPGIEALGVGAASTPSGANATTKAPPGLAPEVAGMAGIAVGSGGAYPTSGLTQPRVHPNINSERLVSSLETLAAAQGEEADGETTLEFLCSLPEDGDVVEYLCDWLGPSAGALAARVCRYRKEI